MMGSDEAISWQAREIFCFRYRMEMGGRLSPHSLTVSADLARPDHLFKNLVAVDSKSSFHPREGDVVNSQLPTQSWTDASTIQLELLVPSHWYFVDSL